MLNYCIYSAFLLIVSYALGTLQKELNCFFRSALWNNQLERSTIVKKYLTHNLGILFISAKWLRNYSLCSVSKMITVIYLLDKQTFFIFFKTPRFLAESPCNKTFLLFSDFDKNLTQSISWTSSKMRNCCQGIHS